MRRQFTRAVSATTAGDTSANATAYGGSPPEGSAIPRSAAYGFALSNRVRGSTSTDVAPSDRCATAARIWTPVGPRMLRVTVCLPPIASLTALETAIESVSVGATANSAIGFPV